MRRMKSGAVSLKGRMKSGAVSLYQDQVTPTATHHVSWLLNFLVTTFPSSMPSRSTIFCARAGCELPLNTLIFGIVVSWITTRDDASPKAMQLADARFSSDWWQWCESESTWLSSPHFNNNRLSRQFGLFCWLTITKRITGLRSM